MQRAERVRSWLRPGLRGLAPYYQAPLEGDPLRLDQNTNLLGPNPALDKVDARALDLTQYPTRDADALRQGLAAHHRLDADNFVCGHGGDSLLDLVATAFTHAGQTMAVTRPSYSLYPFYARLHSLHLAEVPMRSRAGDLDVETFRVAHPRLVVLANPNNPTGSLASRQSILELLDAVDGVVLVDEAYVEYAPDGTSLLADVESHDNLAVLRTFSKAYGLAGLRVGYIAANRELAGALRAVKAPYNVGVYEEAVAAQALEEQAWVARGVATVVRERERLADALEARGYGVHPSHANFLLATAPTAPEPLREALRRRGILARTFPSRPALARAIRFTVGGPSQTAQLLQALDAVQGAREEGGAGGGDPADDAGRPGGGGDVEGAGAAAGASDADGAGAAGDENAPARAGQAGRP